MLLRRLGYPSYYDYLSSDLWKAIRWVAFRKTDGACYLCRRRADTIHHYDYDLDTLLGMSFDRLYPLCDRCHRRVEFTRRGRKRSLAQSQSAFTFLQRKMRKGRLYDVTPRGARTEWNVCGRCGKCCRRVNGVGFRSRKKFIKCRALSRGARGA